MTRIIYPLLSLLLASTPVSAFVSKSPLLSTVSSTTQLFDSESSDPWAWVNSGEPVATEEEVLLRIRCSSKFTAEHFPSVLLRVQDYITGFPFERALPIQSMECKPSLEANNAVDLIFRRDHDQSKDGGLRFACVPDDNNSSFELHVKRISEGQTCLKSTTEKLVVKGFVQGFTGHKEYRSKWESVLDPPTDALVNMESLFHRWMFAP